MKPLPEITALLQRYFDTLYHCDLQEFDSVFHPQAIYVSADKQPLLYRDMPTYREVIAQRTSPASRGEQRQDSIDAIELLGDNTAQARVRCSIGAEDYVDLLSLVRSAGQWRIIAKVFHIIDK